MISKAKETVLRRQEVPRLLINPESGTVVMVIHVPDKEGVLERIVCIGNTKGETVMPLGKVTTAVGYVDVWPLFEGEVTLSND